MESIRKPTPASSKMWVLWDAGDDDRPFAAALLAAVIMGASLCRSPIGEGHFLGSSGDVLVGFLNNGTGPAKVELRHTKHSEGNGLDTACLLRVEVPAAGRALAFHEGALVVVGLAGAHELALRCDGGDVSAVYAIFGTDERRALSLDPDKVLPYHRRGVRAAA